MNKMHEFNLDDLSKCLVSMIKMQRLSQKTKSISNQVLLQIFDKWNYELEDPEKNIRLSNLAEVYYQVCMNDALQKEIDVTNME